MNTIDLFAQLPALPSGALETWLLCALALLPTVALAKKLFSRKDSNHGHEPGQYVTHADLNAFSQAMRLDHDALRDRIDARFLAVSDKVEQLRNELLSAQERRTSTIHQRLNEVESGLARVDERTRL